MWQQLWWWFTQYTPRRETGKLHCYLFYLGDQAVGYGLASIKTDGVWISGGLRARVRGMGYGKQLFSWLVEHWGKQTMFLDVFETNIAGITIYQSLGFKEFGRRYRKNVMVMRRKKNKKS
jgi:ribosomal protein S18 acetylase RimI-like enzyme